MDGVRNQHGGYLCGGGSGGGTRISLSQFVHFIIPWTVHYALSSIPCSINHALFSVNGICQ